jgi:hypothetical protein
VNGLLGAAPAAPPVAGGGSQPLDAANPMATLARNLRLAG